MLGERGGRRMLLLLELKRLNFVEGLGDFGFMDLWIFGIACHGTSTFYYTWAHLRIVADI